MDHGLVSIPVESSELTRPNTGSSFYSGVTSPGGSSEDEFFDAPESLGNHGQTRTESPSEPRISTPLVSTNLTPTLQPIDSPIFPVLLEPALTSQTILPNNFLVETPNPRCYPSRDDFSSLDSTESASETETITAVTVSPLMETEDVLTEETAIPGFNGGTTNILTFLSPNPDSATKEFTFTPIKPPTPDLPPLPDSELLDETLRNGLLTPDFPPPNPLSADGLLPPTQLTSQSQMEPVIPTDPQNLYPELDMSSPPLWGQQELPLSPFAPTQDPSVVQALPQMERNPLYVPDQTTSCLLPDLMLLGSMPPGLLMNPLTQQLILAQQQALTQHYSANIPQVPFPHQMHGNNIMPANFMTGFQNFSPHNFNNMSTPFGNFNEGQFDSNETWNDDDDDAEWKRDLILKEKRILRDKYGDNHMNILTDRQTNKPTHHFHTDPQETENMSPLVPNSPEPEKCDSSFQCGTHPLECHTEDNQPDRICYPSLPLNSSDEEPSNDNETTKILPAFLSRMKHSNSVPPPPHDTSYTTLFINQTIPTQNSSETHETHSFNEQLTNQSNISQNAPRDMSVFPSPPPLPIYYPPNSDITWTPNKPILYPPEHKLSPAPTRPTREIKRPPLDTSSSPSPLKPCKREISYPPGLEPSTSPKKQIIYYPPSDHKRIRYPPQKDILRPQNTSFFLNKSSSFHFNNESSFSGDKEILYPHSWTEALSPRSSPVREIHYPPRAPVRSDVSIPEIPKETAGDITPPIQDSSDNEEVSGTSCPLESTPIKKSLVSNTEDKPDLDSDLGGFETPTELD